jgi:mannose-6-phosphate isomerase
MPGMNRGQIESALREGRCEECLHSFEVRPGDCVFLPAGTVHALGAGILAAEVQQSSDTTFRLFDWHRPGPDGKPRALHIEQGLNVIDFSSGPVGAVQPMAADDAGQVNRLVECDKFVLDRWNLEKPARLGGDEKFHALIVLDGEIRVQGDPAPKSLSRGDTILLPACLESTWLYAENKAVFLDAYLP